MGILLVIVMITLVGPLALVYGVDSRDTGSRPRSWWPAARR